MRSCLLPIGDAAERILPTVLSAVSGGITKEIPELTLFRISSSAPSEVTDALLEDLNNCCAVFSGRDDVAFFRTHFSSRFFRPALPDRAALTGNGSPASAELLAALRGKDMPLSYHTDREAVEWAFSSLIGSGSEQAGPFLDLLEEIRSDLSSGQEVRVMLLCDLCDGYSSGIATACLRALRAVSPDPSLFIGVICLTEASGAGAPERMAEARDTLQAFSDRELIRITDERDTCGADAAWLLSLPASMVSGTDSRRIVSFSAARTLGEVFASRRNPSAGMHIREVPGVLTLHALGDEAKTAATFVRSAVWCLSDLFPSLRNYLAHPVPLRSLAPMTRSGLFRRLFRRSDGSLAPADGLDCLDRTFRAILLEILLLIRTLPDPIRTLSDNSELWQKAVRACGRAVTLASEYDVTRRETEESGVDKVIPVHRVSMADTEEEKLLRRLDQMAEDLSAAVADRTSVLAELGGFRARQALKDCHSRCTVALVSAKEKLALMPSDSSDDRLSLAIQERRVRLLTAAVRRCETDLSAASEPDALTARPSVHTSAPFSGELLDPALAEQCLKLLTSSGDEADAAAKALRDGLSGLLAGYPLSDVKLLLRNLLSACVSPDADSPLRSLLTGVFSVCGVEVSGLRFTGTGDLPAFPLLPDMKESSSFFTVSAAAGRLIAPDERDLTAEKRGLLAMLILRQYRRQTAEEASVELLPCSPQDSPLSAVYLSSRGMESAWIVCLSRGETRLPFAVLLPGHGLEIARLSEAHSRLVPSFTSWYMNSERPRFTDPCIYLSDSDCKILTERISVMRSCPISTGSKSLSEFLAAWQQDISDSRLAGREDARLAVRLKIACGLPDLSGWKKDLLRIPSFYERFLTGDPVCAALCGAEDLPACPCDVSDDVLYAFRHVPFARESESRLLVSTHLPEEDVLLSSLDTECDILLRSSDDYHEALAAGIESLLDRFPDADAEAKEVAQSVLAEAREPIGETVTSLVWPWDTVSASVLTILTECLGEKLASAALHPFSPLLALFPARGGEILGDNLLSSVCTVSSDHPEEEDDLTVIAKDAVLPPLSPEFSSALCRNPEGRTIIRDGFLRFERAAGGIRVDLTLEGAFTLRLSRIYGEEDIIRLYTHDMPTVALWPSLPFAPAEWRAYYAYAHLPEPFRISVITENTETVMAGTAPRCAAELPEFPLCFVLMKEDRCIGCVPNILPLPETLPEKDMTVCIDFGSSASAVVFTSGDNRWPLRGPVMVRTLLRNPANSGDLLRREFIPALPVTAVLPGALRIFRGTLGRESSPLSDACIPVSSSFSDVADISPKSLYSDLKWLEEKGRAAQLYLHQVMIMAALAARCDGARTLNWRTALPDGMAAEGRESLAALFRSLAETVSKESCLPFPVNAPPVSFFPDSSALGAYFRLCSPEETRGGFMTLDIGADTADISLFLRGREEAVRTCQLPLGIHYMLLPCLLNRPDILTDDLSFAQDPVFLRDLHSMVSLLDTARRDPSALRHLRCALDSFIADHTDTLHIALYQRMAENAPARTGALLLLHFSYLMMLSGLILLQISADPNKNDFLPEQMSLCLAGRGSSLIERLSDRSKTSLWHFLTMFRNPRVASLSLLFSAEKKLELAVGMTCLKRGSDLLPAPSAVPASIAVRPEDLLPEFLLRFRREFPAEAALLFPNLYSDDPYAPFTPRGLQMLSDSIRSSFTDLDNPRPYSSLSSTLSTLLELVRAE